MRLPLPLYSSTSSSSLSSASSNWLLSFDSHQRKDRTHEKMPISRFRLENQVSRKPVYYMALTFFILLHVVVFGFLIRRGTSRTAVLLSEMQQATYKEQLLLRSSNLDWFNASLTNLIIVAGHTVFKGVDFSPESLKSADSWVLESHQETQLPTFLKHMELGVKLTSEDPNSLLLFSGGETREEGGPMSEAQSYWFATKHLHWFGFDQLKKEAMTKSLEEEAQASVSSRLSQVSWRTQTEEFARDSLENVLFSICRFKELTGRYPYNITVVGFEFKRQRFLQQHRLALRFPEERFHYVGHDGVRAEEEEEETRRKGVEVKRKRNSREEEVQNILESEKRTREAFSLDPYGCRQDKEERRKEGEAGGREGISLLKKKAGGRNPFRREHPYPKGCPELKSLFSHCSSTHYKGLLPWG